MYQIDRKSNRLTKIDEKAFAELGFKEREHLQEWIVNEPKIFGEEDELLIIQKEFDGFADTKERLDVLALDKNGNLVIVENKLDDSGRDVTWQAIKYASYCSSLRKEDIRIIFQEYLNKQGLSAKAEEVLCEFFELEYEDIRLNKNNEQRIILVAAKFRKEVTSTVLWLMGFGIRMQCFKVTPYKKGDDLLLDIEQIIPVKGTEEYTIKKAEKVQEDIRIENNAKVSESLRLEFWAVLLKEVNKKTELFKNVNPKKDSWIAAGSGYSGVPYLFSFNKDISRVELYIDVGNKEENKKLYDFLYKNKNAIEKSFGDELNWNRAEEKKASFVYKTIDKSPYHKEDWAEIIAKLSDMMPLFEGAIAGWLKKYKTM